MNLNNYSWHANRIVGSKTALQRAKASLEEAYSVVGVLEELEGSLAVMEALLPRFMANATGAFAAMRAFFPLSAHTRQLKSGCDCRCEWREQSQRDAPPRHPRGRPPSSPGQLKHRHRVLRVRPSATPLADRGPRHHFAVGRNACLAAAAEQFYWSANWYLNVYFFTQ